MAGAMRSAVCLLPVLAVLLRAGMAVAAPENLLSLYQQALQYDAQYRGAVANTTADREEVNKARALFLPRVQFSANVGQGSTDRTADMTMGTVETSYDYTIRNYALSVRQPLFNKESMASYRGTQAAVKGREALLQKEDAGLIGRIANAYFEILYAQERTAMIGSKIVAVEQQLAQAQRRYDQGEGTITEINEAQANLDLARAELIEANNSLSVFRQTLSDITGQTIDAVAALNPEHLPLDALDARPLEDWLQQADSNNPDIAAARYALEAAQHDVERKRAGHYPTLDLVGARSYSENDNNNTIGLQFDTTTVALQFNLPLYAGGYVNASTRQAQDRLEAAMEQLNLKMRDTNAAVRKYFNRIESGVLTIEAYQQAVKSSEVALAGTEKGFAAGLRTNIEVLNAQQRLYASRLDLSKACYMLINDVVNIKQVAGVLDGVQLQALNRYFMVD